MKNERAQTKSRRAENFVWMKAWEHLYKLSPPPLTFCHGSTVVFNGS